MNQLDLTVLELNAIFMGLEVLIENMAEVKNVQSFNDEAIKTAKEITDCANSALAKLQVATGVKNDSLPPYKPGDEHPFINEKMN